jgi:hydrogenase/urease accessory protein HupE
MLLTDPMFYVGMLACVTVIGLWATVFSNYGVKNGWFSLYLFVTVVGGMTAVVWA